MRRLGVMTRVLLYRSDQDKVVGIARRYGKTSVRLWVMDRMEEARGRVPTNLGKTLGMT